MTKALELFKKAKEAFNSGDMATVREFGNEAGDRLEIKGFVYVDGFGRIHVDDISRGLDSGALVEKNGKITLSVTARNVLVEKKQGKMFDVKTEEKLDFTKINEFFKRTRDRDNRETAYSHLLDSIEAKGL